MIDTVNNVADPKNTETVALAANQDSSPSKWKGLRSKMGGLVQAQGAQSGP